MELDELKDMWKKQEMPDTGPDIRNILRKRSNNAISRMKRHLLVELWFVVILYGGISAYFISAWDGRFFFVSILYIVTAALFLYYYYRKMNLLKEMECMSCQVKSNLVMQVATLEKYVKLYLIAGTAVIPLFMAFFYWFDRTFVPPGKKHLFVQPSASVSLFESLGIFAAIVAGITIVFYFLNKWYVHRLYGRYIDKLKQVLEQMTDES
jgi:hypothetical protein